MPTYFIYAALSMLSIIRMLRLGYSIAIQSDASIILVDESLAVGDKEFTVKCDEQFLRFKREGKTVVLVSHDVESVRSLRIARLC